MQNNKITLSVVSHGHGKMVKELLNDLMLNCDIYRVIITINLKDEKIEYPVAMEAKIITIINTSPKGFSENHNYAFKKHCTSEFVLGCVRCQWVGLRRLASGRYAPS